MATGPLTVGPKPPEVTVPIARPCSIDDDRAFARRRAAFGLDADALARSALRQSRGAMRVGADEAAFAAPPLADRPDEVGLDRARRLVDVMAIEAEARLEPQRIAGAEPDRLDLGSASRGLHQLRRILGGDRDLEAVLAGIAGARDMAVRCRRMVSRVAVMKASSRSLGTWRAITSAAFGPCKREQRACSRRARASRLSADVAAIQA